MTEKILSAESGDQDPTVSIFPDGGETTDADLEREEEKIVETVGFDARYRILCRFASGGVGVLSKARDLVFDRIVAVKTLNAEHRGKATAVGSFLRESRLNANLDHPSIVPVYALGRNADGDWECVMKLINGVSFAVHIDKIRKGYDRHSVSAAAERLALSSRLEAFLKITEAVEYCHSMNIIHGDIKPNNILIGNYGEVYLMDWGCAREINSTGAHVFGTPNYLPPEFLKTRKSTSQIDIFALGMILFELTTLRPGRQQCTGKQSGDCTCALVFQSGDYVHYQPDLKISRRLQAVIRKAIHPDPTRRYASVRELAEDVRHYIYDEEVSALPDSPSQKIFRILYRNRVRTIFAGALLFLLIVSGGFAALYAAAEREKERTENTALRFRIQNYTVLLSRATEKNLLQVQAQLLLFANNILDTMDHSVPDNGRFYSPADYRLPDTSPSGMIPSPLYQHPINLNHITRYVPAELSGAKMALPGNDEFVEQCDKILFYNLNSHVMNTRQTSGECLLSPDCMIQRMLVFWANGVRYSYPGTCTNPKSAAFAKRWDQDFNSTAQRRIYWTTPYLGQSDRLRICCKYPLYPKNGVFLGTAGLELRLKRLLQPLILATEKTPEHRFFVLTKHGAVIAVRNGELTLMDDSSDVNGFTRTTVLNWHALMKRNVMQQQHVLYDGEEYYLSSSVLPSLEGLLFQLISVRDAQRHNCTCDVVF